MDIYKDQYEPLYNKLKAVLPLKALPERGLLQVFKDAGKPITLKTELTITDVYNSVDISGIMCTIKDAKGETLACALTHLIFSSSTPNYNEIIDYQKKREKRIKKLNMINRGTWR